ncbi:hypothetical protein HDU96_002792, partial [Phlyctochytrium bullatum]
KCSLPPPTLPSLPSRPPQPQPRTKCCPRAKQPPRMDTPRCLPALHPQRQESQKSPRCSACLPLGTPRVGPASS